MSARNNPDLLEEFEFFFKAILGIGEVTLSNNKITVRVNMKLRTTFSSQKIEILPTAAYVPLLFTLF